MSIFRQFVATLRAKMNPIAYARSIGVSVGDSCRMFSLHPGAFGSEPFLVSIGNAVTLTAGVRFVTHDGSVYLFRDEYPELDALGPISIGDNSFVGMNSIIMPGVTVGKNCVIGAMSLVTRSIPDGMVVAGNPAKIICSTTELLGKLSSRSAGTGRLNIDEKRIALDGKARFVDRSGRIWFCEGGK